MFGGEFGYVLQVHWYPPSVMGVIQCVEQGTSVSESSFLTAHQHKIGYLVPL